MNGPPVRASDYDSAVRDALRREAMDILSRERPLSPADRTSSTSTSAEGGDLGALLFLLFGTIAVKRL